MMIHIWTRRIATGSLMEVNNSYHLILIAILLKTFTGCEDIKYRDIPALTNAKATLSVSPEKDVYQVGDKITISITAEKEQWNNWPYFEKAVFSPIKLLSTPYSDESSDFFIKDAHYPSQASLKNGKWTVEQREAYILQQAKTYVLDVRGQENGEGTIRGVRQWEVTYRDKNTIYSAVVPVVFTGNRKTIQLVVEE